MEKKFKQWWWTRTPISTKQTQKVHGLWC